MSSGAPRRQITQANSFHSTAVPSRPGSTQQFLRKPSARRQQTQQKYTMLTTEGSVPDCRANLDLTRKPFVVPGLFGSDHASHKGGGRLCRGESLSGGFGDTNLASSTCLLGPQSPGSVPTLRSHHVLRVEYSTPLSCCSPMGLPLPDVLDYMKRLNAARSKRPDWKGWPESEWQLQQVKQ